MACVGSGMGSVCSGKGQRLHAPCRAKLKENCGTRVGDGRRWIHRSPPRHPHEGTGLLGTGVDLKYPEHNDVAADEFEILGLRRSNNSMLATRNVDHVHALATATATATEGMGLTLTQMGRSEQPN